MKLHLSKETVRTLAVKTHVRTGTLVTTIKQSVLFCPHPPPAGIGTYQGQLCGSVGNCGPTPVHGTPDGP